MSMEVLVGKHWRILNDGFPSLYAKAVGRILSAAIAAFRTQLGIDIPAFNSGKRLNVYLQIHSAHVRPSLFFQPALVPSISYCVPHESFLRSPANGGPHHVYGICHELGHLSLFTVDSKSDQRSASFNEALADFLANVLLPSLHGRLGDAVWPDPYNYTELDCPRGFRHSLSGRPSDAPPFDSPGTFSAALWLLVRLTQRLGLPFVPTCIRAARSSTPIMLGGFRAFDYSAVRRVFISECKTSFARRVFHEAGF